MTSTASPRLPGFLRRSVWASTVAQARRRGEVDVTRPTVIAVAALDNRMITTPISALVGLVVDNISALPVAMLDAETTTQPLRGPLGAGTHGDLFALASAPSVNLRRADIEPFADTAGALPLIAARPGTIESLAPETLDALLPRIQHRWPVVIVDLPYTCPAATIAAGTRLADHVLLVADRHHAGHDWLYQPGHHLTAKARAGAVTVVAVDAQDGDLLPDTVALPHAPEQLSSRARLRPSVSPDDIAMYNVLLGRIFGSPQERLPMPR